MKTIKKIKCPNFSRASLSSLLAIRMNNYLGAPRKVKGGYAQVDYPPDEIDEIIMEKESKLDARGELEYFRQYDLAMKQKESIEAVYQALELAYKYGCPVVDTQSMDKIYSDLKDL